MSEVKTYLVDAEIVEAEVVKDGESETIFQIGQFRQNIKLKVHSIRTQEEEKKLKKIK